MNVSIPKTNTLIIPYTFRPSANLYLFMRGQIIYYKQNENLVMDNSANTFLCDMTNVFINFLSKEMMHHYFISKKNSFHLFKMP